MWDALGAARCREYCGTLLAAAAHMLAASWRTHTLAPPSMCASMALIALPAGMAAAAETAAAAASQPISSPSIMPGGMLAAGHVLLDGATASATKDEAVVPSGGAGCLREAGDDGEGALHSQQSAGNPAPPKESAGRSCSEAEQPASAWQQPGDPEAWSGTATSDDAKLVQV